MQPRALWQESLVALSRRATKPRIRQAWPGWVGDRAHGCRGRTSDHGGGPTGARAGAAFRAALINGRRVGDVLVGRLAYARAVASGAPGLSMDSLPRDAEIRALMRS